MPSRHLLFVVGARVLSPKIVVGGEFENRSVDVATAHAAIDGRDGEPIEITPNQWQFLRGVYAMNPEAPRGLPRGDTVVLLQNSGESDGLLFFFDCDKPGPPMHAPPALLSLMEEIAMNDEDLRP